MDTTFRFQEAVGKGPFELDRRALDTGAFAVLQVEFGQGPALLFAVHAVHAKEHFGPILTFGAPGAGVDLHHGGQFVLRLVERALELCFLDADHGLVIGLAGLFFRGLAGLPEFKEHDKVFHGRIYGIVELDPVFVQFDVLENFRRALVVIPEARAQRKLLLFVYLILSVIDVKETSSGRPHGPSYF